MSEDFTDVTPRSVAPVDLALLQRLNTIGVISYVLHLLVAILAGVIGGMTFVTEPNMAIIVGSTEASPRVLPDSDCTTSISRSLLSSTHSW